MEFRTRADRPSGAIHCYQDFPVSRLNDILDEIGDEFRAATDKFPTWPTDPLHAVAVVGEEFGELNQATLQHVYEPDKASLDDVRTEAIQTATMAVRFLLSLDDYEFNRGEQHHQS